MDSTERLRRRIEVLGDLQSIVKTMKALSAVSIRQYRGSVLALTDYYRTVELGLHGVLRNVDYFHPPVYESGQQHLLAAVVFGSDYGLCGRFNEDVTSYALEQIKATTEYSPRSQILAVGSRVKSHLESLGHAADADVPLAASAAQIANTVQQVLVKIDHWRSEANLRYLYVFYNRMGQKGGYQPMSIKLLPMDLHRFRGLTQAPWPSRRLPTFTIDRQQLLTALVRQYFFVRIFRACAESQASEHASRLVAMQSAEKHLDERKEELTTRFHRLRQDAITNEMLDIVSGFEAITADQALF
ncbi:F0F1 ATP synthase subunit gamma [Congregibacter variabilis]|uniref:F0F1 ATP synthase subunit gamma n=1 Tax=Congregibacter variabilis TaxID=3081200 RepID=A0ABZ0I0U8_9GAMM|nr:F0F1 ATP synthase subunit gamma [Congregibacter sp. IMCC43200]